MSLSYLSKKAVTRHSTIHGRGTFAVEPISPGEVVALFGGYVYDVDTFQTLPPSVQAVTLAIWPGFMLGPLKEDELGDGDFVNHSCEPNCGIVGQIMAVARKAIAVGDELTLDYGTVFIDHGRGSLQMDCRCDAPTCRKLITSEDWRDPTLRARHRGYLSAAVQARIDAEAK